MNFQKQPWKHDPLSKNFTHNKLFGSVPRLPRTLNRPKRPVEDQGNTLRCAAYSAAVAGGYIHSRRFSPDWQARKITSIQGFDIDDRGSDPNAAMKSQRDYGYLPKASELAPDADTLALGYHVAGWVKVVAHDGLDTFDAIREALFMAYNPNTQDGAPVHAFGTFYHEWTRAGIIPTEYSAFAGYHAYLFVDFITTDGVDYLIAQNSYGPGAGATGFHYFPREVVNREFARSGTTLKIAKPLTPDQIARAKETSIWGAIQRTIIKIWYSISETYGSITRRS